MKLITEISHNRFIVVVINNDGIMTVTGCIILAKNSSYCAYKLAITASKMWALTLIYYVNELKIAANEKKNIDHGMGWKSQKHVASDYN